MENKPQQRGIVLYGEQEWVQGMKKSGPLRLVYIPNFGRSPKVNACVKKILNYVHGGNLWLDIKVEIREQLISSITGLLIQGEDLEQFFAKESEKELAQNMYEKYDTTKGARGFLISKINNDIVKFSSHLMDCKLL